jgi:hypothetical protein
MGGNGGCGEILPVVLRIWAQSLLSDQPQLKPMQPMEPSLARQVVLEEFKRSLPERSIDDLRQCCERLAELALVLQPAAIRWLVDDAITAWGAVKAGPSPAGPVTARHEAMAADLLADLGVHHS